MQRKVRIRYAGRIMENVFYRVNKERDRYTSTYKEGRKKEREIEREV